MKIGVLDEKWEGSVEKNATSAVHKKVARELAE